MEQQEDKSENTGNIAGRAAVIMPYQDSGFWGLWEHVQKELGIDLNKNIVHTETYWTQYDLDSDKKETE